jgi:UDP-glucose 4-epimerase
MLNVISGGAGFIGMNLGIKLIAENEKVLSIDNFSGGMTSYPALLIENPNFDYFELDLSKELDNEALQKFQSYLSGEDFRIWHFAANSDIQKGVNNSFFDYRDTLGTTLAMIELSRKYKPKSFIFSSSSAVYGDHKGMSTSETAELMPISNYGNMKLSSEIALQNSFEALGIPYYIFRFPNVIGLPLTHGLIHDVYKKLLAKPSSIQVLGDGRQQKPYIHVNDLLAAIFSITTSQAQNLVVNIGPDDEGITVEEIVNGMRDQFSPSTNLIFGKTKQGWLGDIPQYKLDVTKLSQSFDISKLSSRNAVLLVIQELMEIHK